MAVLLPLCSGHWACRHEPLCSVLGIEKGTPSDYIETLTLRFNLLNSRKYICDFFKAAQPMICWYKKPELLYQVCLFKNNQWVHSTIAPCSLPELAKEPAVLYLDSQLLEKVPPYPKTMLISSFPTWGPSFQFPFGKQTKDLLVGLKGELLGNEDKMMLRDVNSKCPSSLHRCRTQTDGSTVSPWARGMLELHVGKLWPELMGLTLASLLRLPQAQQVQWPPGPSLVWASSEAILFQSLGLPVKLSQIRRQESISSPQ